MKSIISTWPLASRLDWFGNYDTKIIGGFLSQRCIPIPLFFFLISMSWMTERFSDLKYWYYIMSTKIWALTFQHKELFEIDWSTQKFKWTMSSNTKRRDWVRKKYLKKNRWVLSHHSICIKYTNATVHFACRWNEVKLLDLYRSENKPLIHKLYLLQVNKSGFPPK